MLIKTCGWTVDFFISDLQDQDGVDGEDGVNKDGAGVATDGAGTKNKL